MATRQYIGARYVPKFFDNGSGSTEWTNTVAYEPLTIVTYSGNSYTSKKPVPVGIDISNTEYWVSTGVFNEQINTIQSQIQDINEQLNKLDKDYITVESFGAVGDGETDDSTAFQNAINASNENNTPILLLEKKYYINKTLTLPSNLTIKSLSGLNEYGNNTTIYCPNVPIFKASETYIDGIYLENITFMGSKTGNGTFINNTSTLRWSTINLCAFVYFNTAIKCNMIGVRILNSNSTNCNQFMDINGSDCIFNAIFGQVDPASTGFDSFIKASLAQSFMTNLFLTGGKNSNSNTILEIGSNSSNIIISGSQFDLAKTNGISISGPNTSNIVIIGNNFRSNGTNDLLVNTANNIIFKFNNHTTFPSNDATSNAYNVTQCQYSSYSENNIPASYGKIMNTNLYAVENYNMRDLDSSINTLTSNVTYKKQMNTVYIEIADKIVSGTSGTNTNLGALPNGFRPLMTINFAVGHGVTCQITTNGNVFLKYSETVESVTIGGGCGYYGTYV